MPVPAQWAKISFPRSLHSSESGRIQCIALRAEAPFVHTHSLSLLPGGFFHGFDILRTAAKYLTLQTGIAATAGCNWK